jgi:hypothetical protein
LPHLNRSPHEPKSRSGGRIGAIICAPVLDNHAYTTHHNDFWGGFLRDCFKTSF